MTLSFDHTHNLDFGVSRSEFEMVWSQEWDCRLTWNEKGVSHPFMTMILTNVIMGGGGGGGRIYQIVTRVTSDIGVPSTHLVLYTDDSMLLSAIQNTLAMQQM